MQIHLVKFQALNYASKEAELPSFDEAFDTDSLKKFFHEHDSHINTPFTTYSETPMYEDLQPSLVESQSIFGPHPNKFQNIPTFNLDSDMEDGFSAKIFNALDERENGVIKNKDNQQFDFLEEKQEKKVKEVVSGGNRIVINFSERSSLTFSNFKEELDLSGTINKDLSSLEQDEQQTHILDNIETRVDLDSKIRNKKKDVFIIHRSVIPKVISKKEKEEKKPAAIMKKKKSVELEKKEEEKSSLKKAKKDKKEQSIKTEKVEKLEKIGKEEKAIEKSEKSEKKQKKKSSSKSKEEKN